MHLWSADRLEGNGAAVHAAIKKASSDITMLATGAERDSAVRQNESLARDVAQLREASAAVQQQLTAETLGRQTESEKASKVWQSAAGMLHCYCNEHCQWARSQTRV